MKQKMNPNYTYWPVIDGEGLVVSKPADDAVKQVINDLSALVEEHKPYVCPRLLKIIHSAQETLLGYFGPLA